MLCFKEKCSYSIEHLCYIFVKSDQKTIGTYNVKGKNQNTLKKENKPWFDIDRRFARQNYRKLKKRFKRLASPQNRLAMIDAKKHYKHTLDNKYKNITRNIQKIFKI